MIDNLWFFMPQKMQNLFISILKMFPKTEWLICKLEGRVGYRELREYAKYLCNNFQNEVEKINANPKFMKINLDYHVGFFNAGILLNVIENTVIAMKNGCIPVFYINENLDNMEKLCLNWFFTQPYSFCFGKEDLDINKIEFTKNTIKCIPYRIEAKYLWNIDGRDWAIWSNLAKKILKPNEFMQNYVEEDMKNNGIIPEQLLGVLIRGTDYLKLKPRLHPVQPEVDEMIEKIEDTLKDRKINKIYLATDEKRVQDRLEAHFGAEAVYINARQYYDEIYRKNNLWQICDAKIDRENDQYYSSLEYISSMIILSRCNGIVGGNCTGSLLAALLSQSQNIDILNKGVYT